MASTISAFYIFTSTSKALSSNVNDNFSIFRGDLIPFRSDTIASIDNSLDLGSSFYQWNNLYIGNEVYQNSSKFMPSPVGTVVPFALITAPSGWLNCDGSSVSRTTYGELFNVLCNGTNTLPCFGFETTTHFNLPDLRGKFIRGVDNSAGNDPDASSRTAQGTNGSTGDSVGSIQGFATYNHFTMTANNFTHAHTGSVQPGAPLYGGIGGNSDTTTSTESGGDHIHTITYDNETRPINLNLKYCIRY